jgi:hypothetical protein
MDNSQGNNGDYRRRGEIKPRKQGKEIEGKEAGEGDRRKGSRRRGEQAKEGEGNRWKWERNCRKRKEEKGRVGKERRRRGE